MRMKGPGTEAREQALQRTKADYRVACGVMRVHCGAQAVQLEQCKTGVARCLVFC